MTGSADAAARLAAFDDDVALAELGFRDDDREDVRLAIRAALADPERLAHIQALADGLRAGIGAFGSEENALRDPIARDDWRGVGVVPLLALLATADDVRDFYASRGISREDANRSLSDIGQQAWVHRRTFGAFGLHTYEWLATAFSGNLLWLGRLQFNLVRRPDGWALSTHIPETGPLPPASVDDAFERAAAFFAEHFPDYPTRVFHCGSWLLDPHLADVLSPESNMVRFQSRWALEAEIGVADADAVFFVFRRRGDVDHSTLPRDTTLQRAILDTIAEGGHWHSWSGTIDQAPYLRHAPEPQREELRG